MSLRIDSTEWISGALLIGETGGGVLGSTVPSSGDNGPGYIYNDLSLPADAAKEVCGRITTWPALGTLTAFEDTSFYYVGPDGTHTFQYQLYADYTPIGAPTTVTLEVGVTHGAASAVLSTVTLSAPEATASGTLTANGVATAPVASIGLTPPAASASASAVATGAVQSISTSAPSASASAGTGTVDGVAYGALAAISISGPSAVASNGEVAAARATLNSGIAPRAEVNSLMVQSLKLISQVAQAGM